jgi:hypothetical protein
MHFKRRCEPYTAFREVSQKSRINRPMLAIFGIPLYGSCLAIGEGGMGAAEGASLRRKVALKFLCPAMQQNPTASAQIDPFRADSAC